jgi:hypothetical protein
MNRTVVGASDTGFAKSEIRRGDIANVETTRVPVSENTVALARKKKRSQARTEPQGHDGSALPDDEKTDGPSVLKFMNSAGMCRCDVISPNWFREIK